MTAQFLHAMCKLSLINHYNTKVSKSFNILKLQTWSEFKGIIYQTSWKFQDTYLLTK